MTQNIEDRVGLLERKAQSTEIILAGVNTQYSTLEKSLGRIEISLSKLDSDITTKYVTKESFQVVQWIVFGFVALILTAVVGALIAMVVINRPVHQEPNINAVSTNN